MIKLLRANQIAAKAYDSAPSEYKTKKAIYAKVAEAADKENALSAAKYRWALAFINQAKRL